MMYVMYYLNEGIISVSIKMYLGYNEKDHHTRKKINLITKKGYIKTCPSGSNKMGSTNGQRREFTYASCGGSPLPHLRCYHPFRSSRRHRLRRHRRRHRCYLPSCHRHRRYQQVCP